jgi:hypothetical protein
MGLARVRKTPTMTDDQPLRQVGRGYLCTRTLSDPAE